MNLIGTRCVYCGAVNIDESSPLDQTYVCKECDALGGNRSKDTMRIRGEYMDLKEYQKFTRTTAFYPGAGTESITSAIYLGLGLTGESGEVAEKIKKAYRDGIEMDKLELAKELGDVMWYVSEICNTYNMDMESVLKLNKEKLESRKERDVLKGSGDNR